MKKINKSIVEEKVVLVKDRNNSLVEKMFGFRRKIRTNVALLSFISKVYNGINEDKPYSEIFVDVMNDF